MNLIVLPFIVRLLFTVFPHISNFIYYECVEPQGWKYHKVEHFFIAFLGLFHSSFLSSLCFFFFSFFLPIPFFFIICLNMYNGGENTNKKYGYKYLPKTIQQNERNRLKKALRHFILGLLYIYMYVYIYVFICRASQA